MAKFYFVFNCFCRLFIILLGVSIVLSQSDYHFYNLDYKHRSEYSISIELLENEGRLHKRDVFPIGGSNGADYNVNKNTTKKIPKMLNDLLAATTTTTTTTTTTPTTPSTSSLTLTRIVAKKNPMNDTTMDEILSKPHNLTPNKKKFTPNNNKPILTNDAGPKFDNTTNDDDDDDDNPIDNIDIDDNALNKTLTEHNITNTKHDTHIYYNTTLSNDENLGHYYWVNLTNHPDVKTNELLSKSYRRAATVKLSFEFPFYGHLIKNITIATGGFLYTGDYIHSWLAATQYIAPLMANFDTSLSNDSYIKYLDNGTTFTVQWENVRLKDNPNNGEFTFQTTLYKNGDIIFVYKNIPLFIKNINDILHPVKVGLSDAYNIDKRMSLVRRKTIYEYHRVNFLKEDIKNWTSIYIKALPTCLDSKNCTMCLTNIIPTFNCTWCPIIGRCSNGLDRNRQDWLENGCETKLLINETLCSHITGDEIFDDKDITYKHDVSEFQHKINNNKYNNNNNIGIVSKSVHLGMSSIVAILFLICSITGLAMWILYAYRNPHTTSGQILIRYRPSQWRWKRGEARYTAATIHM